MNSNILVFFLQIFRKSVEFCNEHEIWKLNVAHVLFMQVSKAAYAANNELYKLNETDSVLSFLHFSQQENKYKEAVGFYEPIVKKHYDNVSISAVLLKVQLTSKKVHRKRNLLIPVRKKIIVINKNPAFLSCFLSHYPSICGSWVRTLLWRHLRRPFAAFSWAYNRESR